MKKMKKIILLMTCAFVLLGTTACGSRDNADNGADQTTTDGNRGNDNTDTMDNADDRTMNDATEGNGILDDAVHDVTDGVDEVTDDVTDGVDKAADKMTDDNGAAKDTQDNR